jgi:hypothetical protein
MSKNIISLVALALVLGACAKGISNSTRTATPAQLKAMNDTSKKSVIDNFMSVGHAFMEMEEQSATVQSFDLATSPDNKFALAVKLKNGTSIQKVGQIARDYDSSSLNDLELDTVNGAVRILNSIDTQQNCVSVDVNETGLAKGPSSISLVVCEPQAPAVKK